MGSVGLSVGAGGVVWNVTGSSFDLYAIILLAPFSVRARSVILPNSQLPLVHLKTGQIKTVRLSTLDKFYFRP